MTRTGAASHRAVADGTTPTWYGELPGALAGAARDVARTVAERLAAPARVMELAVLSAGQAVHPVGWAFPGFAHGHAGLAVLHLAAARSEKTGSARARCAGRAFDHLREAVSGTQVEPLSTPGIFAGTAGLALCLADCCVEEPRFLPSLGRLHEQLAEQVIAQAPPRVERGVRDGDYDLVAGAAGVLAHLAAVDDPTPSVGTATARTVDYLTWLGGVPDDPSLPHRWLVVPECYSPHELDRRPPDGGYLNLGAAHGLPGAVSALAAAWVTGLRRPGQDDAIRRMASWIVRTARSDDHGPLWPTEIPVSPTGEELHPGHPADQLAWCYGTAGVAASLLAVADALGDTGLRTLAVAAFEAVLRRTGSAAPPSPTLCHGRAGLLALCLEFAAVAPTPLIRTHCRLMVEELVACADPARPLLFADVDEPGNVVDSPALLTGATGVALTLFAATSDRRPPWLRAFLGR